MRVFAAGTLWPIVRVFAAEMRLSIAPGSAVGHDGCGGICPMTDACDPPDGERTAWMARMGGVQRERDLLLDTLPDGSTWVVGETSALTELKSLGESCPHPLMNAKKGLVVARYDRNGRRLWSDFAGGGSVDNIEDISVSNTQIVFFSGSFAGHVTFGAGQPNESNLVSEDKSQAFVARYAPDGSFDWVANTQGSQFGFASNVAALDDGSVYAAGRFAGEITFGVGEAEQTVLTSVDPPLPPWVSGASSTDGFVAKYNPDGTLAWARHLGGKDADSMRDAIVLPDQSLLITSTFKQDMTLGQAANSTTLTSPGDTDGFVARYQTDGTLDWVQHVTGTDSVFVGDTVVQRQGTIVVRGGVIPRGTGPATVTFDPDGANETTLADATSTNGIRAFLAAYDMKGTFLWARWIATAQTIAALHDGSIVAAGSLLNPVTFGLGTDKEVTLTPTGSFHPYSARFAPDGTFESAKLAPPNALLRVNRADVSEDGALFLSGSFSSSVNLFSGKPNEVHQEPQGENDLFLIRFADINFGAGDDPACDANHPNGVCPSGQECMNNTCQPAVCPDTGFRCGPSTFYSSLDGVSIEFPAGQKCQFTLAEILSGAEFHYELVIDKALTNVISKRRGCSNTPPPEGGLFVQESVRGDGNRYCQCDFGFCISPDDIPVTLTPGRYAHKFSWDGQNWNGPSDTGVRPGPPFPVGEFVFEVLVSGTYESEFATEPYEVRAWFGIDLIADEVEPHPNNCPVGDCDCDPLAQTGCLEGQACYVSLPDNSPYCRTPIFEGAVDTSCAGDEYCAAGSGCFSQQSGTHRCVQFCDSSNDSCQSGRQCVELPVDFQANLGGLAVNNFCD